MAKRSESVYAYAKYFADPVKKCILGLENWFSTDIDDLYEKLLSEYLENRQVFKEMSFEKIIEKCKTLSETHSNNTYNILVGAFNEYLKANQGITHETYHDINKKLDVYKPTTILDLNLIKSMREIEEEIFK